MMKQATDPSVMKLFCYRKTVNEFILKQ